MIYSVLNIICILNGYNSYLVYHVIVLIYYDYFKINQIFVIIISNDISTLCSCHHLIFRLPYN